LRRTDNPRPRTAVFSVAQAKRAGLWGKPGPWHDYADLMLLNRARGFAGRKAFPDVLRGVISEAEVTDIVEAQEPPAVRRLSEAQSRPE
jgi:hypothetical protein